MCPWNLLKDSNNFTTYLSAYSVFMSSIAGVMISDYYTISYVRKGYLQIKDLYSARKSGPYFFIPWEFIGALMPLILLLF
jgi:NCS1 family nucleobase:cation symporter-1